LGCKKGPQLTKGHTGTRKTLGAQTRDESLRWVKPWVQKLNLKEREPGEDGKKERQRIGKQSNDKKPYRREKKHEGEEGTKKY